MTIAADYKAVVLVDATGDTAVVSGGGVEAAAVRVTIANDSTGLVSIDDNGGSLTVDGTITANAGTGNFSVVGTKSSNGGVPGSTNLGILAAVATAAAPSYTEGNQVSLSTDLAGGLRTAAGAGGLTDAQLRAYAATLGVTATAAVGTGVTLTLPAAGAGNFQYISKLEITADTATVALGANASAVVTSTNLNGTPAWNVKIERNGGGVNTVARGAVLPFRSAVANTATTIVAPATANTVWRLNVEYYTGP